MSSYFGEVKVGVLEGMKSMRAGSLVQAGTYVGVAPEITSVLYAPGDIFGMISALASLVPIFLCVAQLTVFLCRRTAADLWIGGGQIVCEILNGVVKVIIRQPRPSSPVSNMPADSYGMPSAHAQYMGYFSAISMFQTLRARNISWKHRALRVFAALSVSFITAYSRYYLYYHSGPQIVIGYFIGFTLGVFWLLLLSYIRHIGLLKWGLTLWPCTAFFVKDVSYSVSDEYEAYLREKERKEE